MSVTVTNCFEIMMSPLNTSSAKFLYSIPKANRFGQNFKPLNDKVAYDLPQVLNKRATGIGYGKKFDFTKNAKATPPPNAYETRLDPGKTMSQWSFGLSRDMVNFNKMIPHDKKVPGPGAYEIQTDRGTGNANAYSMRPRTVNPQEKTTDKLVPGPGTYNIVPGVSKNGKYFISKYHDSGALIFNPPKSKRFGESLNGKGVPGPGNYNVVVGVDPKGNYFDSKYKGSMCRSFSQAGRRAPGKPTYITTPGPGSYRLPSDFGIYESKIAFKSETPQARTTNRDTLESLSQPKNKVEKRSSSQEKEHK